MTTRWVRYRHEGHEAFGTLDEGDRVHEYRGSMFAANAPTGKSLPLEEVQLLMPVQPTKVIALWNNFGQLRAKLELAVPEEPLYFLKSPNSWGAPGQPIPVPQAGGKVIFEGELGIVIGRRCAAATEGDALACVFGYTCANDVTVMDILNRDPSFPQWVRAKGHDGFCPLGPVVATGLDPATLKVRTLLDGLVRQDYPISDMTFSVAQLVSRISVDMTLMPGDVILCGTSVGVGSMKPGSQVEVEIAGIGRLSNRYG